MMSAVTTASSVCGCRTRRRMTTTARMIAPATMPKVMSFPTALRRSLILAPEHEEPRGEGEQPHEARVHERRRTEVRGELRRDEQLPHQHRENDAGHDADQP